MKEGGERGREKRVYSGSVFEGALSHDKEGITSGMGGLLCILRDIQETESSKS